jgi:hypothetical protein
MWVTKSEGRMVFNEGRVVATPDPRNFIANTGYVDFHAILANALFAF